MKTITLFTFAFILTLLFLEFFLRFTDSQSNFYWIYDDNFGITDKINNESTLLKETFSIIKTNNYGLNGPNFTFKKKKTDIRIALIGDSFVEGAQVKDKYHFRNILEKKLNKKFTKNIEVLNFGKSFYSLYINYFYFKKYILKFNPDITIFFLSYNDYSSLPTNSYSYYDIDKNDSLKINKTFFESSKYKFYKFIQKYPFFNLSFLRLLNQVKQNDVKYHLLFDKLYSKKNDIKKRPNLSTVTKKILSELNEFNKRNKTKIIFAVREEATELSNYIEQLQMKTINLYDTSTDLENKNLNPFYWKGSKSYGHWNYIGHKKIAHKLEKNIISVIDQIIENEVN